MICEYLTVCPQEAGLAVIKTPPTLKIRGVEANFAFPKGKSLSLFILSDDSLSLLLRWKVKYNYLTNHKRCLLNLYPLLFIVVPIHRRPAFLLGCRSLTGGDDVLLVAFAVVDSTKHE